jgi:hypothetical protein
MVNLSNAFHNNPDGSWSCTAPVTLAHPTGPIPLAPGATFCKGATFMGVDVAEWLDRLMALYGPGQAHSN